jgi:hypothetical protein
MQMLRNIPGPKLLARIKVDEWGVVENKVGDLPSPQFSVPAPKRAPAIGLGILPIGGIALPKPRLCQL